MSSQNESRALNQAREAGVAEAIDQLRTFTGIAGYVPGLNEPEHLAYVAYEQELTHGLEVWKDHQARRQNTVDLIIKQRDDSRRAQDAEKRRRQEERATSNIGQRLLGKLQDAYFPEKRTHSTLAKEVDAAWETRYAADTRVHEIETELTRVSNWINQMLIDVDAVRATRT